MENWEVFIDGITMPTEDTTVYIWGAGNTAVLAHQGMMRENLYDLLHVKGYIDSGKSGTELFSLPVLHPDILDTKSPENLFVFICTTNPRVYSEIAKICKRKNVAFCGLDAAILKLKREYFLMAAGLMDDASQKIYHTLLYHRATVTVPEPWLYAGESYFGLPEFCQSVASDVIVDCGAYVGDSAERYIWRMEQYRKYIAIEPDSGNYRAMLKRFERLRDEWNLPGDKLVAIQAGLDDKSSTKRIQTRVGGLGSIAMDAAVSDCDDLCFWAIDDLIHERFSFLKADIESYEYRMLQGARKSILQYKPRMAICIYHNMPDMYGIPLLIHEIDPTYQLAIRHHSYGYEETVLYAY